MLMQKITLISPYFGEKFPSTFPALLDSMKHNPKVRFLIPTNIEPGIPEISDNITFVRTNLRRLNEEIDVRLGYHATIKSAYKLVDFKPMFGDLFASYIADSMWWGYFDSDIIFGDISHFLTDSFLEKYDRIFTHGHLTLFRNSTYMNSLWHEDFHLPEVPSFKEVATSPAVFAFDEWGWGKNKGRGLSYALNYQRKIRQFDDNSWFADIDKNKFEFNMTSGKLIEFFTYYEGKITGFDKDKIESNYLYVHFQKRSIIDDNYSLDKIAYITPNVISNKKEYSSDEVKRWKNDQKVRRFKQIRSNLNMAYLKRRLRFMNTER